MRRSVAVSALALAFVTAACGTSAGGHGAHAGADAPVEGAPEVEVVATEFAFAPTEIAVTAGEPTNVVFVNDGRAQHDVSNAELGFHLHARGGQEASGALTIDQPGTYEFICSVPGHAKSGMKMTVTAS